MSKHNEAKEEENKPDTTPPETNGFGEAVVPDAAEAQASADQQAESENAPLAKTKKSKDGELLTIVSSIKRAGNVEMNFHGVKLEDISSYSYSPGRRPSLLLNLKGSSSVVISYAEGQDGEKEITEIVKTLHEVYGVGAQAKITGEVSLRKV